MTKCVCLTQNACELASLPMALLTSIPAAPNIHTIKRENCAMALIVQIGQIVEDCAVCLIAHISHTNIKLLMRERFRHVALSAFQLSCIFSADDQGLAQNIFPTYFRKKAPEEHGIF